MQIVQTGGKRIDYKVTAVAVYDPSTGRICHLHHTVAPAGRTPVPAAVREREALEHASRAGHTVTALKTLVLNEAPGPGAYRVDHGKRTLIRLPMPKRRGAGPR
jgi:hypothetical protein